MEAMSESRTCHHKRERERERKYIDFEKDEENVRAWEKNREIEREKRRKEEQKD